MIGVNLSDLFAAHFTTRKAVGADCPFQTKSPWITPRPHLAASDANFLHVVRRQPVNALFFIFRQNLFRFQGIRTCGNFPIANQLPATRLYSAHAEFRQSISHKTLVGYIAPGVQFSFFALSDFARVSPFEDLEAYCRRENN